MHKPKFGIRKITLKSNELWVDRKHRVYSFEKEKGEKK
jgi:hypothetical protein